MSCQWPGCQLQATHTVTVDYPTGRHDLWQVCTQHDKDLKKQVQRSIPLPTRRPAEEEPVITVACADCGSTIEEPASVPTEERAPCPSCGSTKRLHTVALKSSLDLRGSLSARHKRPARGGWLRRLFTGEVFSTFHGAWTKRELDIDEQNDAYRERLVHHDGTAVESKAKLSDHQGHGG